MKLMDKFLNAMRLNDEDDYDEDFYEEDEIEEAKRKSFSRNTIAVNDFEQEKKFKPKTVKNTSSKVTPLRTIKGRGNDMQVCVIKPTTIEDSREVTETLLSGRAVILNLEGLDVEVAQRIIDFTSGSCFAINGNLQKVSNYIFIITPPNVEISGDFQNILTGAFDVSPIQGDFKA